MAVVLLLAAGLRAVLGYDTAPVSWATLFGVVLFAVLTGL